MFIISFLWGLLELGIVGVTLFYLWIDYRRGFASIKYAIERAYDMGQRLFHFQVDENKRARAIVSRFAQHLGVLREAVATLQANYEVAMRQAKEQEKLAQDFRQLGEAKLREGDEDTAHAAASAEAEAEKRMNSYVEMAESQVLAAEELQQDLDQEELDFAKVEMQAETINVEHVIAEAKLQLYALLSDVEARTGLTSRGALKQLLESSRVNRIKSDKLLAMARRSSNGRMRNMIEDGDVRQKLEAMRQRIALPEGISHNGATMIERSEDDIVVPCETQ